MRMVGIEQNSPSWIVARIGCVTASRLDDVCKKLKTKPDQEAAAREDYRYEKLNECLTGRAEENPPTVPMIWGINNQPLARTEYELKNNIFVEPGGFWMSDKLRKFRASPDYLVGQDGLLEIKCPFNGKKHTKTYMKRDVPDEYLLQIVGQLAVTGRQWCDFVSFDPRQDDDMQLVQIRVYRDQEYVRDLVQAVHLEVEQFLLEIEQTLKYLGKKSKAPADQPEPIFPFAEKAVAV